MARRDSFRGFQNSTMDQGEMCLDRRVESLESKIATIVAIDTKLDKVIKENEDFRKEVMILTRENTELLREKVELEGRNAMLGRQCEEMKLKIAEMERKLKESEEKGSAMNIKIDEVRTSHEEAQTSFREIIKQQEKQRSQLAQKEVVKVLQQEEEMVRNIAERKKCVVIHGLREEKIEKWQERKEKEEEKIKTLLNNVLGEDSAVGMVEEHLRLGKFEEGKSRAVKVTLKSQGDAESLLRNAWKLKNSQETNMIYVRRNMSQEERIKMKEMVAQMKQKNEERTEEEKEEFFWKIRNDRLWKWWIKGKE